MGCYLSTAPPRKTGRIPSDVKFLFKRHLNGAPRISGACGVIGRQVTVRMMRRRPRLMLDLEATQECMGYLVKVSPSDSCLFLAEGEGRCTAGALKAHFDDFVGCAAAGVPSNLRNFLSRKSGPLKRQGRVFVHVGMGVTQRSNFPVTEP